MSKVEKRFAFRKELITSNVSFEYNEREKFIDEISMLEA